MEAILEHIDPYKDVDGFPPLNVGRLAMRGVHPVFVPCTPLGSVELLTRYGIELTGKKAVILGNSNTVGMPLSMLLRDEGCASVTVCHCTAWDFLQHSGAGGALWTASRRARRSIAEAAMPLPRMRARVVRWNGLHAAQKSLSVRARARD